MATASSSVAPATIAALAEAHFDGLRRVLDAVAREQRFLAFTRAPPLDDCLTFYRDIVAHDRSHFVALLEGAVVGWCDVLPTHGQARSHVGTLGIGLLASARGRGLGRALMQAALDKAWAKGLERIELTVRADNHNAKALYERMGFGTEGFQVKAFQIDGVAFDGFAMALLR
jgi:ribosomal protein S18 acetylase RimI-like enzyme